MANKRNKRDTQHREETKGTPNIGDGVTPDTRTEVPSVFDLAGVPLSDNWANRAFALSW